MNAVKMLTIMLNLVLFFTLPLMSGCSIGDDKSIMITATLDASVVSVEMGEETLQIEGVGEFYYKEWGELPQTFHNVTIDNSLYPYTEGETPIGVNYYSYSFEFEDGAINYMTWARYALDTTTTADGTNIYLTEHISPQAGIMRLVSDGISQSYMLVSTG
jgi:hypothetical protein